MKPAWNITIESPMTKPKNRINEEKLLQNNNSFN